MFSKLVAIGKLEFKTGIVYRLQFFASVIISPLILLMFAMIWSAVYSNTSGDILGYNLNDMITYYVLSMIIGHVVYNMVGSDLQEKITYGELIQDLLRPISVLKMFFARTMADRSFALIAEAIPVFFISVLIFKIKIPKTEYLIFFVIALAGAFVLNFLLGYLMGILAFWINKIESIQWLMFIATRFLSGEFIPLDFLGPMFLKVSEILPFYYIRFGIIQIFLEKVSTITALATLAVQFVWIIILYLLVKFLWFIALRKFGAEGG